MGVCAARLTNVVSFPRLAFYSTMPTAGKHLVSASIFGELPIPSGEGSERIIVELGMWWRNFKGATP